VISIGNKEGDLVLRTHESWKKKIHESWLKIDRSTDRARGAPDPWARQTST
jgi:hypothetical protein